jgi:hypothetical protein
LGCETRWTRDPPPDGAGESPGTAVPATQAISPARSHHTRPCGRPGESLEPHAIMVGMSATRDAFESLVTGPPTISGGLTPEILRSRRGMVSGPPGELHTDGVARMIRVGGTDTPPTVGSFTLACSLTVESSPLDSVQPVRTTLGLLRTPSVPAADAVVACNGRPRIHSGLIGIPTLPGERHRRPAVRAEDSLRGSHFPGFYSRNL